MKDELRELAERIERLVSQPEQVEDAWGALARPIMRMLKWKPTIRTKCAEKLVDRIDYGPDHPLLKHLPLERLLEDAVEELDDNVGAVERACVVHGQIPMAYTTWLWRLYQVLARAQTWIETPSDSWAFRASLHGQDLRLLPPLVTGVPGGRNAVHVGAIDPLIEAARNETQVLGRRRRLLEAAREMLLDASAALTLDDDAVRPRRLYLHQEIARIDRMQAAGLSPDVALAHQLRQAATRGDIQRVHAAVVALDDLALRSANECVGRLTSSALDDLWGHDDRFAPDAAAASLAASGVETFSESVRDAVAEGYQLGTERVRALRSTHARDLPEGFFQEAEAYLKIGAVPATLAATLAVDGCFDVGGVLTPVRAVEENRRPVAVRYPTRDLVLLPAESVDDIPASVVDDPRSVLLQLATGRLLTRRFLGEVTERRTRTVLRGEARIYVLDGSASMLGPRARMRDAILVAELSTLTIRLNDPLRQVRPILYYRYFNENVGPTERVATPDEALESIRQVLGTLRSGGTDIERALLASFEQIRMAQAEDPDLCRAQIVLVTDGEAPVDEATIQQARRAVGDLPVGVSIIALGEENLALRRLAARQRAQGERVFYQFIDDAELAAIVHGKTAGLPIHLPTTKCSRALSETVLSVVDEIEAHQRGLDLEQLESYSDQLVALEQVGLSLDHGFREAARARFEALNRDRRTLLRRFYRWFPEPEAAVGPDRTVPGDTDQQDLDLLLTLLGSVAEVVDLVGSPGLRRQADAIEVFEHLLLDAGMPPWRVAELFRRYPSRVAPALRAVRSAAGVEQG